MEQYNLGLNVEGQLGATQDFADFADFADFSDESYDWFLFDYFQPSSEFSLARDLNLH